MTLMVNKKKTKINKAITTTYIQGENELDEKIIGLKSVFGKKIVK
jgi:hypothetical protein